VTRPAETSALPRQFSLPVLLSVALHGLAVVVLGTFQLSPPAMSLQNQRTMVDLVTLPPEPVVEPVAEPVVSPIPEPPKPAIKKVSVRKVPPKTVKRVSPRSAAPTLTRARPVTTAAAPPTAATVTTGPVVVESSPQPVFKDLPRVPAPASPPAMAFNGAAIFSVPESMEPPVLLNASVGSVYVRRPLPAASAGGTKLLRDPTAEAGSVRSRVRAGNNPRPEYPRAAREAGWEGTVILRVLVLPDGRAESVTLHKTSGHSILDEAALSAVKDWRFIPAMDGNFPMQSAVHLPIRFDLKAAY
jgi:periplasmic protein TonB